MEEIWKDVKGYEGRYKISDKGRVWSLVTNKELRVCRTGDGYLQVCLRKDGQQRSFGIHQLLFNAFLGGYDSSTGNGCGPHRRQQAQQLIRQPPTTNELQQFVERKRAKEALFTSTYYNDK